MEIESEREKTGELDSAQVLLANQLAMELAKYDGPMAKLFEILEAQEEGKSKEELKEILRGDDYYSTSVSINNPCRERCKRDMELAKDRAQEDFLNDLGECLGYAVIGGLAGATAGPKGAMAGAAAGYIWCGWNAMGDQNTAIERAEEDHRTCVLDCKRPT